MRMRMTSGMDEDEDGDEDEDEDDLRAGRGDFSRIWNPGKIRNQASSLGDLSRTQPCVQPFRRWIILKVV